MTYIAADNQGKQLRAGSLVHGPGQGEQYGQLLGRVDERADSESVHEYEAALNAARLRITQAQAQVSQARNNLGLAENQFERMESIWQKKLVAREQYDSSRTELLNARESLQNAKAELATAKNQEKSAVAQLNQAKVGLEKTSIYAPFNGILRKVNVKVGDYWGGPAGANSDRERETASAMVIVDNSQYEITLDVPYYAADKLAEDQPVYISWNSAALLQAAEQGFSGNLVAKGKVFSVSPGISLDKRAVEVKVHTTEGAELLKDGLYVTAWIMVGQKRDVVVVPNEAIITRNNKPFVYVVGSEGKARLKAVEVGVVDIDKVEIVSGLSAGEKVITIGQHKLVNGTEVRQVQEQADE